MKPTLVCTIKTPQGKVEMYISTSRLPSYIGKSSNLIPKITWKINGKRSTQRDVAQALAKKFA